jgi:hypothetical protein
LRANNGGPEPHCALSFERDTPSRALQTDFCRCAECKLTKIVIGLLGVVTLLPCNATKSTVRELAGDRQKEPLSYSDSGTFAKQQQFSNPSSAQNVQQDDTPEKRVTFVNWSQSEKSL